MPLYLVRWPDLSGAFVNAPNEDELLDILDQLADPSGCTWTVFRGPLHIEFRLNVDVEDTRPEAQFDRPIEPDELKVGSVDRIRDGDVLSVEIAATEVGAEMRHAILRRAFPAIAKALDLPSEREPTVEELRDAIRAELGVTVQASWRTLQTKRRPDALSQAAASMGTDPRLIEHWMKQAVAAETRPTEKPPRTPPKKPVRTPPKKPVPTPPKKPVKPSKRKPRT